MQIEFASGGAIIFSGSNCKVVFSEVPNGLPITRAEERSDVGFIGVLGSDDTPRDKLLLDT